MQVTTRALVNTAGILLAATVVLVLAVVSVGHIEYQSVAERFVAKVGPLEPEKYAPEPVPDVENAARWIRSGVEAVKFEDTKPGDFGDRHWIEQCSADGPAVIPADKLAAVRAALASNATAFTDLEKAVALPRANWGIDYASGVEAHVPNLLKGIRAAKALACDARLAVADADPDRAARRIEALGRMARAYESEPIIIVLLIGIAIERMQLVAVRDVVASPAIPPETLVAIDAALGEVPLRERLRTAIAAEAAAVHRSVEKTGTPSEPPAGMNRWERVAARSVWKVVGPIWMSNYLSRTADVHEALAATPARRSRANEMLGSRRPWWSALLPDLPADFIGSTDRAATTETMRNLARRAIRIRVGAAGGAYPLELDPPLAGTDDPFSGEPFTWAVAADGSATLSAATTGSEAAKVLMATKAEWWRFPLPAPTPPAAPSSSSPTTPGRPGTPPSLHPPARTPPR
jgi:hypothetical protein